MAVPKRKTSPGKRNQKRSHHALKPVNILFDSVTGEPKLPHHISLKDGYYNGTMVLEKYNRAQKKAVELEDAEEQEA